MDEINSENYWDQLFPSIATRFKFEGGLASNGALLNPDKLMLDNQFSLKKLRNLLNDPHVFSCVQSRKSGVLSLEYTLVPTNNQPVDDFVAGFLSTFDLRRVIQDILDAVLFGFAPLEILYTQKNGYIVPVDLVGKPANWFEFDVNNVLRFKPADATESAAVPNMKFIVVSHNATYDNPYGYPVLSKCIYPVLFKVGTQRLWAEYCQKFGTPAVVAKAQSNNENEWAKLQQFVANIQANFAGVAPSGSEIQLIESNKGGSGDLFQGLIHYLNAEISKIILSQTLTTEQGDTGSYAMSKTHLQIRADVVDTDKYLVESALNKLIQIAVELNFPNASAPKFIMYEATDVDKVLADRDKVLWDMGIRFTPDYIKRVYGFEDTDFTITEPAPALGNTDTSAGFSEPIESNPQMEANIEAVTKIIKSCKSFEEAEEKVIKAFPTLKADELSELIGDGIIAATFASNADFLPTQEKANAKRKSKKASSK